MIEENFSGNGSVSNILFYFLIFFYLGESTEPGLKEDANAALDYLLSRDDIDHSRIVLFGRSAAVQVAHFFLFNFFSFYLLIL